MLGAVVVALLQATQPEPVAPEPPVIREIARGVWLAPDSDYEGLGPNGNSILVSAPRGFVAIDTGRHDWHTATLLAFAETQERPIVAIVNTHWHLDHSSGNHLIKARFPGALLYSSMAGVEARESGMLAQNYAAARLRMETEGETLEPARRARLSTFLSVMENLAPDVAIDRSQRMRLGGRMFDVRFAAHAATAGDVWLYDRRSRIAFVGDLVTLPAPYLDTGCPDGWRVALAEIAATPFRMLVPGHGAPMTREQFVMYHDAFNAYLNCVVGTASVDQCATSWAQGIAPLLESDTLAITYAAEYATHLRENGGRSAECRAPR